MNDKYVRINDFIDRVCNVYKIPIAQRNRGLIQKCIDTALKRISTPSDAPFKRGGLYLKSKLFTLWHTYGNTLRGVLRDNNIECEDAKPIFRNESKNILMTDEQIKMLSEAVKVNVIKHPVDIEKVKYIVKYLDKSFKRGKMHGIGEDGFPKEINIVGMIGTDGSILRNMTDVQLFYLLQERFSDMYSDTDIRDRLLKQIIKDWYPKKIKNGMLTVNMI